MSDKRFIVEPNGNRWEIMLHGELVRTNPKRCEHCNGTGKLSFCFPPEDNQCRDCNGRGKELATPPPFPKDLHVALQKTYQEWLKKDKPPEPTHIIKVGPSTGRKRSDKFYADATWLPGSPPLGFGSTAQQAVWDLEKQIATDDTFKRYWPSELEWVVKDEKDLTPPG